MAKISALPVAENLDGSELIPVVRNGKTHQVVSSELVSAAALPFIERVTVSAAAAEALVGKPYATSSDGIADTDPGQSFAVNNGNGTTTIWFHDPDGTAKSPRTMATTDYIASSEGADDLGLARKDVLASPEGAEKIGYGDGNNVKEKLDSLSDSGGIIYALPATAAVPQTQAEKNEQTVDLFDALTPAMRSAVKGGTLMDIGPAVSAIMHFANGGESQGDATGGTTLYVKGGRYFTSVPLNNTFRADKKIVDDGDLRRMNLRGDGSNNTSIFYTGPYGSPALNIAGHRGTDVHDGVNLRTRIEGIRLRRFPIKSQSGIGLRLQHAEGVHLDDVVIDGFEVGIYATDILEFFSSALYLKDCVIGLRATLSDFTNPNVFVMRGGGVSGARVQGIHLVRPANAKLDSVRFEGNGFDRDFTTILCELGTPEGGASLLVENCYFENNMGASDLQLAHGHPYDALVKWHMNTCHRQQDRYVDHHIDAAMFGAAASAGSSLIIDHGPQRYRNVGTYTSHPSRSAIRIQTPGITLIEHAGNRYPSDNERPETNGFPAVGMTYNVMSASIFADGTYTPNFRTNINVLKVEHLVGSGVYRVFYRDPPRNAGGVTPSATVASGSGTVTVSDRTSAYLEVRTFNADGAAADLAFTLNVMGYF